MSATFAVCFGPDTVSAEPLFWIRSPLHVHADPESYRQAGMCAPVARGSRASQERYDQLVGVAIAGTDSFASAAKSSTSTAGVTSARSTPTTKRWSGTTARLALQQSVRRDRRAGARGSCRPATRGGGRWPTSWPRTSPTSTSITPRAIGGLQRRLLLAHPALRCRAQHRDASRVLAAARPSSGGGPSNEHNYTTGLMLHYFLTGSDAIARRRCCNWPSGSSTWTTARKSRFRWIDRGDDRAWPAAPARPDFHGPGRGAGNSINALLDAHRLTGDPRYLDKADALIRAACIRTTIRRRSTCSTRRTAGRTRSSCRRSASISTTAPIATSSMNGSSMRARCCYAGAVDVRERAAVSGSPGAAGVSHRNVGGAGPSQGRRLRVRGAAHARTKAITRRSSRGLTVSWTTPSPRSRRCQRAGWRGRLS